MFCKSERGSVLMEFILVIPLYIALLGGIFSIGEMSQKGTAVAHADRVAAFDVSASVSSWADSVRRMFRTDESDMSSPAVEFSAAHHADPSFPGPWTVRAGALAADRFKAPVWTRGWLASADAFFSGAAKSPSQASGDSDFARLVGGGRVEITSKPRTGDPGVPGFSTLKRKKTEQEAESEAAHWRSMRRYASTLVDAPAGSNPRWRAFVEHEPWHQGVEHRDNGCGEVSARNTWTEYERFGIYERWSR